MTSRSVLQAELNQLLTPDKYQDYCPNGLQVEGREEVQRIITGVSLNQELIDVAIDAEADALIVHHGIFWNKASPALTGLKYQRVAKLIKNELNLFAYHLPLDNHPLLGNNIKLAHLLNIAVLGQTGHQDLLWYGQLENPLLLTELVEKFAAQTAHQPNYFGEEEQLIRRIAWCTGGAEGMFEEAIALGVDCFISGEISEPILHLAKESGVAYLAGGHYVTERYGMLALTKHLYERGYSAEFIDLYNPI